MWIKELVANYSSEKTLDVMLTLQLTVFASTASNNPALSSFLHFTMPLENHTWSEKYSNPHRQRCAHINRTGCLACSITQRRSPWCPTDFRFFYITSAFQDSTGSMNELAEGINWMQGNCSDTTLLGSFSENQDNPRFPS